MTNLGTSERAFFLEWEIDQYTTRFMVEDEYYTDMGNFWNNLCNSTERLMDSLG